MKKIQNSTKNRRGKEEIVLADSVAQGIQLDNTGLLIKKYGMKQASSSLATRRRILEAAGECFARCGFYGTTVRDICKDAQVSVAMLHYYFGDKEQLFDEVLAACLPEDLPPLPLEQSAEERLFLLIHTVLLFLHDTESVWRRILLERELSKVSERLPFLVDRAVLPLTRMLHSLVTELLPRASLHDIKWCSLHISGMLLQYQSRRPIIHLLHPEIVLNTAEIERMARHITRFALAGLAAFAGD